MAARNPTGKAILEASLDLFRQDRQMIWLPVMATATALVAYVLITLPLVLAFGHNRIGVAIGLFFGTVVATAATVIFNVALCFAATDRIEGRTPTVRGSLAQAWTRKGVIFRWALLSAVVGTVIRALEQRFGFIGSLIGFAGGLAWAVATFLVVPVLAFEDVGPIEAVKRSSSVLKARFGTVARGGLRLCRTDDRRTGGDVRRNRAVRRPPVDRRRSRSRPRIRRSARRGDVRLGCRMYLRTILYRFATDQTIPDVGVDVSQVFRIR